MHNGKQLLQADHPEGIQADGAFESSWATSQRREGPGSPWGQKIAHTPALGPRKALLTFGHSLAHKQVFLSFSTLASNMAALPSFGLLPQGETRRLGCAPPAGVPCSGGAVLAPALPHSHGTRGRKVLGKSGEQKALLSSGQVSLAVTPTNLCKSFCGTRKARTLQGDWEGGQWELAVTTKCQEARNSGSHGRFLPRWRP